MQNTRVYIHEVSVRDGFQIEPRFIPTQTKIDLINALGRTGLAKIEVTSFTSPRAIPALADAEAVMSQIQRVPGVIYAALVPNRRGCERALSCGTDEINLVMSASLQHSLANLRMSPQQSLEQFADIVAMVDESVPVNVSISTAFGCPFEIEVAEATVFGFIRRITDMGIDRISLCDTTGMANPVQVQRMCENVQERWPDMELTVHFHNTRGMGLANVLAAFNAGVRRFDASLGGLGGCPYAPGASGNVCTEDMVHMFDSMGLDTGVELGALLELARSLPHIVGHDIAGQLVKAGPWNRQHPLPPGVAMEIDA